ncbi:MAG: DUF3488 domain-containing protein [Nitrospirae bacterium]|nr:DUF3488 domain-containing protein [Nitrospirota bacterium]
MLDILVNLSSAILALTGLISVALTDQLNPFITMIGLVCIAVTLLLSSLSIRPQTYKMIPRSAWNAYIILVFIVMLLDIFWISGSLLISILHLSIFLMINKLFNLSTRKDYIQLFLLSLLQFLAASTMTNKLFFGFAVVIFLISATWALILLHLKYQISDNPPSPPFNKGGMGGLSGEKIVDLRFFLLTNSVAVAAFIITILIFFIIPRFGIGFMQKKSDDRLRTSGFTERIDLGDIGPIKLDNTMVMRVRIPDYNDSLKDRIYWRGVTFNFYDGRSWSNKLVQKFSPKINDRGEFTIREGSGEGGLYQEIILEPLDTTVIFGASHIIRLSANLPSIKEDMMGSVYIPYASFTRLQYSAYSKIDLISEEDRDLESASYPVFINKFYLQLPDGSEEIGDLARRVSSGSKTITGKIDAIERYLKTNYRYTLDVKPHGEKNPIEDFLFVQKAGYCEYYATAMVVMLRSIGVPARLVTGFLQGEWNEIGGYFTVRQKDAHSWVEAYLPGSDWVTFDPTPAILIEDQRTALSLLSKYIDSIRLRWDRYIINYSLKDQTEAIRKTREKIRSMEGGFQMIYESIKRYMLNIKGGITDISRISIRTVMLLSLYFLLLAISVYLYIRKGYRPFRLFPGTGADKNSQIVELYKKMLKLLEKRGIIKENNKTPLEFAISLNTIKEENSREVFELTETYYRVRFGQQPLSREEISRISEILQKIKKGPSPSPSWPSASRSR